MGEARTLRFLIVGIGPSGAILGAHLARAGHRVSAVENWAAHREAAIKDGLQLSGCATDVLRFHEVAADVTSLRDRDFDFVVVSVKTPALWAAADLVSQLPGNFRAIVYQNGLDNEELMATRVPRERVMRCSINTGGVIEKPGHVRYTFFNAPNTVGCLCGRPNCPDAIEFAAAATAGGLATVAVPDIKKRIWEKTILNSALSPLSAITGRTIAGVIEHPLLRSLVENILDESIEVAAAEGHAFGPGFRRNCMEYFEKAGHHKPSMLTDIEKGRGTEIDFMNGRIAAHGARLGIPAPVNTTITALVKGLEKPA